MSWHTSLEMAQDAALLARYPSTRAIFTRDGLPLPVFTDLQPTVLRQPDLARSLEAIAIGGPDVFYRGELGKTLVEGSGALVQFSANRTSKPTQFVSDRRCGVRIVAFALRPLLPRVAARHCSNRSISWPASILLPGDTTMNGRYTF